MNAASFGKAFRGTFEDIQTRRLGVRGNSKYHCASSLFHLRAVVDSSLMPDLSASFPSQTVASNPGPCTRLETSRALATVLAGSIGCYRRTRRQGRLPLTTLPRRLDPAKVLPDNETIRFRDGASDGTSHQAGRRQPGQSSLSHFSHQVKAKSTADVSSSVPICSI